MLVRARGGEGEEEEEERAVAPVEKGGGAEVALTVALTVALAVLVTASTHAPAASRITPYF